MNTKLPQSIYTDNSVLIIGSGFCIENENILGTRVPNVRMLYKLMMDDLIHRGILSENDREEDGDDIATLAEFYTNDGDLIELLRNQYTVSEVLKYQEELFRYKWQRIYTTNYDDVIEKSLMKNGINYNRISGNNGIRISNNYVDIIHLNGMIGSMDKNNFLEEVKLTNSSYLKNSKNYLSWIQELEIDLRNSDTIFCLGFSGDSDPKISEKLAMFREKVYMINGTEIGKIQMKKMSSKGNVVPYTVEAFNAYLSSHRRVHIIPDNEKKTKSLILTKYDKAAKENIKNEIDDVLEVISKGVIDENKLFHGSENYLVTRDYQDKIIENINDGYKLIEIHSNLGNGKTIFLKQLKASLSKFKQYKVYEFQGAIHEIPNDVKIINAKTHMGDKNIIIIDDFHMLENYFHDLKKIANAQFIVSVRSSIFDNINYKLERALGCHKNEVITYDINTLSRKEVKQYENILRNKNIPHNFNKKYNNFVDLIIETIRRNNLLDKLKDEMDTLLKDSKKSYPIIAYFCLNLMEYTNADDIEKISSLLDMDINSRYIIEDQSFNEFIEAKKNYQPTLKSPIAIQQLLRHVDIDVIITVLISIMNGLEENRQNKDYYTLQKLLVSYSNLSIIFRDNECIEFDKFSVDNCIDNFYAEIQNNSFCKENPFFWLNYAIQKINLKKYEIGDVYLRNADIFARKKQMLPFYQLNGQRARLCFLKAKEELNSQNINEKNINNLIDEGIHYLFKDYGYKENNISYQYKEIKTLLGLYTESVTKKLPIMLVIKRRLEECINKINSIAGKLNSDIEKEKLIEIKNSIDKVIR